MGHVPYPGSWESKRTGTRCRIAPSEAESRAWISGSLEARLRHASEGPSLGAGRGRVTEGLASVLDVARAK